MSEHSSSD